MKILVSDWWNWSYFHANFRKFWKYDPCLHQFLHWIRALGHRYTRRLILQPISGARPQIDLRTKSPPPPRDSWQEDNIILAIDFIKNREIFKAKILYYESRQDKQDVCDGTIKWNSISLMKCNVDRLYLLVWKLIPFINVTWQQLIVTLKQTALYL